MVVLGHQLRYRAVWYRQFLNLPGDKRSCCPTAGILPTWILGSEKGLHRYRGYLEPLPALPGPARVDSSPRSRTRLPGSLLPRGSVGKRCLARYKRGHNEIKPSQRETTSVARPDTLPQLNPSPLSDWVKNAGSSLTGADLLLRSNL